MTVQTKRLIVVLWLVIAVAYFYLSYGYIRVAMNDENFGEYLRYVVQLAGNENRPSREIRELLLVRADQYGLPIRGDQITISGAGRNLSIAVSYDLEITFPLTGSRLYSRHYQHRVSYNPNF
jgi:hypothetical protein